MPHFLSDDVTIAYEVYGSGKPIVLVHGFSSNATVNWCDTGWVETLNQAGYSCVALDNRGHGKSQKLYDPASYSASLMALDVARLICHLQLGRVPVMGYSMGARLCAFLALESPQLVSVAVFGGMGINMLNGVRGTKEIVAALLAPDIADVTSPVGKMFRSFAEHTGSDRRALAACLQSSRSKIDAQQLRQIDMPVLVAVGSDDKIGGSASELAEILPRGEALLIPDRDHMRATGDKVFKTGVLEFLARTTS